MNYAGEYNEWRGLSPLHFFIFYLGLLTIYALGISEAVILDDYLLTDLHLVSNGGWEQFYNFILNGPEVTQRRPLSMASFAIQAKLIGHDQAISRIVNILIHILNSFLVYKTTCAAAIRANYSNAAIQFGLITTAIWVIFPIHATAVLYPIQRMTLLSATCSLVVLWMVLDRTSWRNIIIAVAFFIIGIGFKEIAILSLPVAYVFLALISPKEKIRRAIYNSLALASSIYIAAVMLFNTKIDSILNYSQRDFDSLERVSLAPLIMLKYAISIALPSWSNFSFYNDDFFVNIPNPLHWTYIASLVFAPGAFIVLRGISEYNRLLAAGIVVFLLLHVSEATIWPLELYFEHRNYIPSVGIAICLASILVIADVPARMMLATFSIYMAWSAIILGHRTLVIGDENLLVRHHLETHPYSYRSVSDAQAWDISLSAEQVAKYPFPIELTALNMLDVCDNFKDHQYISTPWIFSYEIPMRSSTLRTLSYCMHPCIIPKSYILAISNRYLSIDEGRFRHEFELSLNTLLRKRIDANCPVFISKE